MLTPVPRKKEKTAKARIFFHATFVFEYGIETKLKSLVINFLNYY